MTTETLNTCQISDEAYIWYLDYLSAIDNKALNAYGSFLADNCVMIQNNQPPVSGKADILQGLQGYWQSFRSLTHELLNIYGTDHAFALEALNHYVRLDGEKVTVRAVALTDRDQSGLVKHFRFYTDVSPVFAKEAPKDTVTA